MISDNLDNNVVPFDDYSSIQAQAREWLIRLDRDDSPSDQELQQLHAWASQSPAHEAELKRISAFWQDANILNELSTPVYDQAGGSWLQRLQTWLVPQQLLGKARPMAYAASACLALLMVFMMLPQPSDATNGLYASALGEVEEHRLVDGSTMHLNTDSQVQIEYSDGLRKIRLLKGEAHFEVAPDQQWPFEVYAAQGRVKALGTAFSVRLDSDSIEVIVSHGRVELASAVKQQQHHQNASPPAIETITSLSLGQSARFKSTAIDNQAEPQLQQVAQLPTQELERQLSWRTGYLVFAGDRLDKVVSEINRYTPLTIEIGDPSLQALKVGGRFKVGEVDAMFEVLETSFGIQVSRIDNQRIQLRRQ